MKDWLIDNVEFVCLAICAVGYTAIALLVLA